MNPGFVVIACRMRLIKANDVMSLFLYTIVCVCVCVCVWVGVCVCVCVCVCVGVFSIICNAQGMHVYIFTVIGFVVQCTSCMELHV